MSYSRQSVNFSQVPKINAAFTLNTKERSNNNSLNHQHHAALHHGLHMGTAANMLPAQQHAAMNRKRKSTTTPPQNSPSAMGGMSHMLQHQQSPLHHQPLPPIASIHAALNNANAAAAAAVAAAAASVPPMQLMATPPASLNFVDNPFQMLTQMAPNANIGGSSHYMSNNYKIHLPPKPNLDSSACSTPATTPTPPLANISPAAKRIKPTTLLKSTDEAWLKRAQTQSSPCDFSVRDDLQTSAQRPKIANNHQNCPPAVLDLTESPERLSQLNSCKTKQPTDAVFKDKQPSTCIEIIDDEKPTTSVAAAAAAQSKTPSTAPSTPAEPPPLEPDYEELIQACREADGSADMEKLIQTKLLKYYYGVHADFVKSKGFRKNVRNVIERIRAQPELVYYNLKNIVEELKARRKNFKAAAVSNANESSESVDAPPAIAIATPEKPDDMPAPGLNPTVSTGNRKTDEQIKKLNKAMYILTKRIERLEEAEVDWDDEDSTYLQVERFKKRACQIYEKICDLTGESKNAHRLVKKPMQFNGTAYPQFNKTLQAFINRTKEFPDYYDVLRMLEHCNRTYKLGLVNFEIKRIAHDAFTKVGKALQSRRKTDLYETVTHYTANAKDPAAADPELMAKLNENVKHRTKIADIIEKFAREQDLTTEEQREARLLEKQKASENSNQLQDEASAAAAKEQDKSNENNAGNSDAAADAETISTHHEAEDEEDDSTDSEEEELEQDIEKLTNGNVSDPESDVAEHEESTEADKHSKTEAANEIAAAEDAAALPKQQQMIVDNENNNQATNNKLKAVINNNNNNINSSSSCKVSSSSLSPSLKNNCKTDADSAAAKTAKTPADNNVQHHNNRITAVGSPGLADNTTLNNKVGAAASISPTSALLLASRHTSVVSPISIINGSDKPPDLLLMVEDDDALAMPLAHTAATSDLVNRLVTADSLNLSPTAQLQQKLPASTNNKNAVAATTLAVLPPFSPNLRDLLHKPMQLDPEIVISDEES